MSIQKAAQIWPTAVQTAVPTAVPTAPRMLRIDWREEGGPAVAPPSRRGFGSVLLERSLAHDLDGKVTTDFHKDGLVCVIEAPLIERTADPSPFGRP